MHEIRCSLKPEVALTAYELLLLLEQVLNVCIMYVCVYVGVCAHTQRHDRSFTMPLKLCSTFISMGNKYRV